MIFEPKPDRFETTCGFILSFLASLLAFIQIMDDNFGAEELKAANEKSQAYQWHQTKGIKQNLIEGQIGLIETLLGSGSIASKDTQALEKSISKMKAKVARYEKEKDEILKGSAIVGEKNWIQDKDGKMGVIIGAQEWEDKIKHYETKGDQMALASMLIQISLVMGGLALILQEKKLKMMFFYILIASGALGSLYGVFHLLI
jgi:hypothetical protein